MLSLSAWHILPLAFFLDVIIGDPQNRYHPIRWLGKAIALLEPYARRMPLTLSVSGCIFSGFLIILTWILTFLLLKVCYSFNSLTGFLAEVVLIYFCISMGELRKDALSVAKSLMGNDLPASRQKLSFIVGRDVNSLDETGVARATVETVAENLVDGVLSPLLYAAIGGAPFAMAFKMISTLDSMIGYKNATYIEFGKSAARIDDVANFIPARLSVPVITIASIILNKRWKETLLTAMSDGKKHSSPNAGYPEAAFAGALGLRLGGPNFYDGELVEKPYIGDAYGEVEVFHIHKACSLMTLSSILWVAVLLMFIFLFMLTG